MFYREAGQFKSSYETDGQIFPIRQDRIGILLLIGLAFVAIPLVATPYFFSAILIPFLIFSLAALGLNILTGYAGQLSLGSAAFMAVGAFSAYNFVLRVPGIPLLAAFILGGLCAAAVGIVFGLPSLRVRGFYLAASTLATQFFVVWALTKVRWFTNYSSSGVITAQKMQILGVDFDTPVSKYLLVLSIVAVLALLAKNMVRSNMGRCWMAVRDMDVAAEVIGIRLMRARIRRMPITSAATSMSRTAIQQRPIFDRTMFLASSASTATMESTSRYLDTGVSKSTPRICIFCAVITPDEL